MTALLASNTGAPDRPPVCSGMRQVFDRPSRDSVVLVAITPAMPCRFSVPAITRTCSSVRSGAILTNKGTRRPWRTDSKRSRSASAPSKASSASSLCNVRRFWVLGDEMLTVT